MTDTKRKNENKEELPFFEIIVIDDDDDNSDNDNDNNDVYFKGWLS
jgi:hypothetical protein